MVWYTFAMFNSIMYVIHAQHMHLYQFDCGFPWMNVDGWLSGHELCVLACYATKYG
jgi:hypothetical protein